MARAEVDAKSYDLLAPFGIKHGHASSATALGTSRSWLTHVNCARCCKRKKSPVSAVRYLAFARA